MDRHRGVRLVVAAGLACMALAAPAALGQSGATPGARATGTTGNPSRDTLVRVTQPITIEFADQPLREVVKFITDYSGAEIEPLWIDDRNATGLDPDALVSAKSSGGTVLDLIEQVLEKTSDDLSGGNGWQLSKYGAMQIGPKERLNRFKRTEVYDISDLLSELPDWTEAPEFDLQSVLQSSQGGGGQSPFTDQGEDDRERKPKSERAEELVDLITALVETEQWRENGGDGGSITYYQGALVVNAPDYIHRQLVGYAFWPKTSQRIVQAPGRRYVSIGADAALSDVVGFGQEDVTAVVGGQLRNSQRPPGGG